MNSIPITPGERRRRQAEDRKRVSRNEKLLKAAGFYLSGGTKFTLLGIDTLVIDAAEVDFDDPAEVSSYIFSLGLRSAVNKVREALELSPV